MTTTQEEIRRLREYLHHERRAAATYRGLAEHAEGEQRAILLELADGEERHAAHWERVLERLGADPGDERPLPLKNRLLLALGRRAGLLPVVPLLERHEGREIDGYADERHAPDSMVEEEREHARLVESLAPAWRSRTAGTLRAGVFGVSDGIVSNLALVIGVVGAGAAARTVVTAGWAGLVAGALSMAVGEYVSVASQREVLLGGNSGSERDDQSANPMRAALASFFTFAFGAFVPLLPFLVGSGLAAALVALALTGVLLYGVGAGLSLLTLRPAWRSGLRQLALGWGAAGVTYLVGTLMGNGAVG